jgi:hypothetical protein
MQSQFDPNALDRYFQFANERHRIYLKREAGESWPWTDNEILRDWCFTNCYRELDKGTVWLRENWRKPFADHPMLFFNICLYRQFNWIGTAEFLGFQENWDPDNVYQRLSQYKKVKGNHLYTNAHMVRGPIEHDGTTEKLYYTVYNILDRLYQDLDTYTPQIGSTLQQGFERLVRAYGFGGFVTYEVITDLRWTRYLQDAADIMTWANAGPGAIRGLNRLLGANVKGHMRQADANEYMQGLLELSHYYLEDHMPAWEMRTVEHTLCELDKYERVRLGQGRPRMKFKPPHLRG